MKVEDNLEELMAQEAPKPYPTGAIGDKEQAKLTKRQCKHIARRAGKTTKEILGLRELMIAGRINPQIKYTVVAD